MTDWMASEVEADAETARTEPIDVGKADVIMFAVATGSERH